MYIFKVKEETLKRYPSRLNVFKKRKQVQSYKNLSSSLLQSTVLCQTSIMITISLKFLNQNYNKT